MPRSIVVICPLEIEHRAAVRAVGDQARAVCCGPGAAAAKRAVDDAAALGARTAILFGVAGGLRSCGLVPPIGRVVTISDESWDDSGMASRDPSELVTLLGVDVPLFTPEEKAAAAEATGATVVDCESHGFVPAAIAHGLVWRIVRGVSDTRLDSLPEEAAGWITPSGTTRTGRVLLDLARRPALLPVLARLGRTTNMALSAASGVLRNAVQEFGE